MPGKRLVALFVGLFPVRALPLSHRRLKGGGFAKSVTIPVGVMSLIGRCALYKLAARSSVQYQCSADDYDLVVMPCLGSR